MLNYSNNVLLTLHCINFPLSDFEFVDAALFNVPYLKLNYFNIALFYVTLLMLQYFKFHYLMFDILYRNTGYNTANNKKK